jgi:CRISPR-associated protein Csm2
MGMISEGDLKQIINEPGDAKLLVKNADEVGRRLKEMNLTSNQIRALFGEVRQIEALWRTDSARARNRLILLKPKMAYRSRKEKGQAVADLVSVLDPAVDLVVRDGKDEDLRFKHFVELFEAILAYHKFYGGN